MSKNNSRIVPDLDPLFLMLMNPYPNFTFENSVDPDQLASEKPADQDAHYFTLCFLNTCC